MKYKVGDKVKVREWDDMAKEFGVDGDGDIITAYGCFVTPMRKFCGKTVTISFAKGHYEIEDDNDDWWFTDEMFVTPPQLIIEHHGRTTVAHIGKRYGVARCNPSDEYDAMTGDILAVQRLYTKKHMIIVSVNTGKCYGVVGDPSPFKDINGNPLKVGDCVDDVTAHHSFIAHNDKYGFYVMGWGLSGEKLGRPLRKVDDYDHEYFPGFKVIPCQQ